MPGTPSILMVVTSRSSIDEGHPTGLWFEEFAVPCALCREPGYEVVVASPEGGQAPVDSRGLEDYQATPVNEAARRALERRLREPGARFVPADNSQDNVVVDGRLVTGPNPQSSASVARAVIRLLAA